MLRLSQRAEALSCLANPAARNSRYEVNVTPASPAHRESPWPPRAQGLYHPAREHDACGLGFIAHIKGRKSHAIIEQGLQILVNLTHRGATGADPLQGDGAGILLQLPDAFFRRACGKLGITLPAPGQYGASEVVVRERSNEAGATTPCDSTCVYNTSEGKRARRT